MFRRWLRIAQTNRRRAFLILSGPLLLAAGGLSTRPLVVSGGSMEPTLHAGQFALLDVAYYRTRALRQGDVVVLRRSSKTYVKRVLAAGGDTVTLLRYLDGGQSDLVLKWQLPRFRRLIRSEFPRLFRGQLVRSTVPDGYCFVVGDNPLVSEDSRSFGVVPVSEICGKVSGAAVAPDWESEVVRSPAVFASR